MLIYFNFEQLSSFSGELDLSWVFTVPFPLLTLVGLEDEGSLKKEMDPNLLFFKEYSSIVMVQMSFKPCQMYSKCILITYSSFIFNS